LIAPQQQLYIDFSIRSAQATFIRMLMCILVFMLSFFPPAVATLLVSDRQQQDGEVCDGTMCPESVSLLQLHFETPRNSRVAKRNHGPGPNQTRSHTVSFTPDKEKTADAFWKAFEKSDDTDDDDTDDRETKTNITKARASFRNHNHSRCNVQVSTAKDGRTAAISFEYAGRPWHYNMTAFSVYAHDANVVRHTDHGPVRSERHEPRTFSARDEGRWATTRLNEDGTVTGFFQMLGSMVQLEPVKTDLVSRVSLLEDHAGRGLPHWIKALDLSSLFSFASKPDSGASSMLQAEGGRRRRRRSSRRRRRRVPRRRRTSDSDGGTHIPSASYADTPSVNDIWGGEAWKGDRWWPGCFTGDSYLHLLKIGVIADYEAYQLHGDDLQGKLETLVAVTSHVLESQLHVSLQVESLTMYTSSSGAPDYAHGCKDASYDTLLFKLEGLKADTSLPFEAVTHIFSGCSVLKKGTIGLAYDDRVCSTYHNNKGAVNIVRKDAWLTFAHELGHNFNAKHSFEEGEEATGGIMDTGYGKIDGEYQFNSKYRKTEMCNKLESKVNNCQGKFEAVTCSCSSPGQGTIGHNGYECTDGSSAYCSSWEECYATASFSKGDSSAACRTKLECECETPGAGTSGHNKFICNDGTSSWCAAWEECYSSSLSSSFCRTPWCYCETPGAGTSGHNKYTCTDHYSAWCAADEECYAAGAFKKGDWSSGCRHPMPPHVRTGWLGGEASLKPAALRTTTWATYRASDCGASRLASFSGASNPEQAASSPAKIRRWR